MRLYYGGYGHHPSGKLYAYWGGDNYRTGQNVVAPVTHYKSGKNYNTMFTIMRTYSPNTETGEYEVQQLSNYNLKSIGGRGVLDLPSGSNYSSASQWKAQSNEQFLGQARARLKSANTTTNTSQARARLSKY